MRHVRKTGKECLKGFQVNLVLELENTTETKEGISYFVRFARFCKKNGLGHADIAVSLMDYGKVLAMQSSYSCPQAEFEDLNAKLSREVASDSECEHINFTSTSLIDHLKLRQKELLETLLKVNEWSRDLKNK